VLRPLAQRFASDAHPELLVGLGQADDAAVWQLDADRALVVTTDFFTPIVDDPADFGAIAAANAMSDVSAMGGRVLFALNLLAVPEDLPPAVVAAIVRGGAEAVAEAGGVVAGGHSIVDREPKYGLAVVGLADPAHLLLKAGARPGDALVLTKALGTGLITTALKRGRADRGDVAAATTSMRRLNDAAARAALRAGAHAATDITGFGLAGHALELARASGVRLRLRPEQLPLLSGAREAARLGCVPGGGTRNRGAFAAGIVGLEGLLDADPGLADVLFDPQTSGGLLVALPPEAAARLVEDVGAPSAVVGSVEVGQGLALGEASDG
jgi:selenide,water dikinase